MEDGTHWVQASHYTSISKNLAAYIEGSNLISSHSMLGIISYRNVLVDSGLAKDICRCWLCKKVDK